MLVQFSVSNFMSFSTTQTVSFRASSDPSHRATHCIPTSLRALPSVNKVAVVLGANGSGKSNFLVALGVMRNLVLNSTSLSQTRFAEEYRPFDAEAVSPSPTVFSIELLLDGVRYLYEFSYNSKTIVSETLHVYQNNRCQRWFERQLDWGTGGHTWTPFSPNLHGPRALWRKATRPQALFLSAAVQLNAEQLRPIIRWFQAQLNIVLPSTVTDFRQFVTRLHDDHFKSKILRIMQAVDFPVADIRVKEPSAAAFLDSGRSHPANASDGSSSIELLYARDGRPTEWLDIRHDSSGSQRLLSVLTPLIDGVEHDRFIAFDEFDTHLHPLIARFLLRLINDPAATHRRVQVLLISQTTALLDLEILRRDELWLMHVDVQYASQLTSFVQYRARKHELIAKTYLKGRYGAVPRIDFDRFCEEFNATVTTENSRNVTEAPLVY